MPDGVEDGLLAPEPAFETGLDAELVVEHDQVKSVSIDGYGTEPDAEFEC